MKKNLIFIILSALVLVFSSCSKAREDQTIDALTGQNEQLQLNQIQVIASHNSYRLRTRDSICRFPITNFRT